MDDSSKILGMSFFFDFLTPDATDLTDCLANLLTHIWMSNDSIFSGIYSPNSSSQVPTTPQYQAPSPSPQAPTTPQHQAPSPSSQIPSTPNTPSNNFGSGDNGIDFGEGL